MGDDDSRRSRSRAAQRWIGRLRPLPLAERLERVAAVPSRERSAELVERLLAECRSHLPHDPAGSGSWARCAEEAASGGHWGALVLAVAYQANADRVQGARHRAEAGFRRAEEIYRAHRLDETVVRAEIDQLHASLLIDLRRFQAAEELLSRAAFGYGLLKQDDRFARVLLKLSNVYSYSGRIDDAIEADHAALGVLRPERHPRLYLYARFNLSSDLVDAGRYEAARDLLAFDQDLYEAHAEPSTRLRVRWLEGRIALATDRPAEAERALLEVREAFAARSNGFDVASVCLDLALLYHRQRRLAELEEIAATAVALFEAQAVHRDALAALVLLREAVTARTATADGIRRVASYLEELRRNPGAQLEQPS